jgi:hypothetical protein
MPCLLSGAMATLLNGKLIMVNNASGSNKLDTAASLDLFGIAAANDFTDKMKVQALVLLERLEAWTDRQAAGMELAQHQDRLTSSFDNLLKVMDALYQVRTGIEQSILPFTEAYYKSCLQALLSASSQERHKLQPWNCYLCAWAQPDETKQLCSIA